MARTSKAQQELEILRDHFDANVAKAVADKTEALNAQIAELSAKLDLARDKYVAMRDVIRELRSAQIAKPVSEAKAAYLDRADQGRKAFNNAVLSQKQRTAAFYEAHPDAKSATYAEINDWFNQPAPVDAE